MARIGRFDSARQEEPRLLARSPRPAGVLFPLLAQLLDSEADTMLLESAKGAHFVIPVVIHDRELGLLRIALDPDCACDLMLELKPHQHSGDLRSPNCLDAVSIVSARKLERVRR